jgi:hypothetical protein
MVKKCLSVKKSFELFWFLMFFFDNLFKNLLYSPIKIFPKEGGIVRRAFSGVCFFAGCIATILFGTDLRGGWTNPTVIAPNISTPSADPYNSYCIDSINGYAIVVYESNSYTYGAIWTAASGWVPTLPVYVSSQNAYPKVALSPSGDAISAIFFKGGGIASAAWNRSTGSWSNPVINSQGAQFPQIAVDHSGNALAVWNLSSGSIYSGNLLYGNTSWSSVAQLPQAPLGSHLNLAMNPTCGDAMAVWTDPNGLLYYATCHSGSWSSSAEVCASMQHSNDCPMIAMNQANFAVLGWIDDTVAPAQTKVAIWNGSWSSPQAFSTIGTTTDLSVTVDSFSNAIATWSSFNVNSYVIYASLLPAGQTVWSTPIAISSAILGNSGVPGVAADSQGNLIVAWQNLSTSFIEIASKPYGQNWNSPISLSAATRQCRVPRVKFVGVGEALVVWSDATTHALEGVYGVNLFSALLPPPSNLQGQVIHDEFITHSHHVHRLTWTPSPDGTVLGYHIYRDNQLIYTAPAAGPYLFDDPNRSKKKSDNYKVTAFNSSLESSPLTINLK